MPALADRGAPAAAVDINWFNSVEQKGRRHNIGVDRIVVDHGGEDHTVDLLVRESVVVVH
jgi:hypothetical protein